MITFSLKKKERQNMNKKSSGQKLSTQASKIMRSNNSSQIQKSLASVLSQRNTGKITGKAMETKASMVMNSNKYSGTTKSLAASVLSQSDKNR